MRGFCEVRHRGGKAEESAQPHGTQEPNTAALGGQDQSPRGRGSGGGWRVAGKRVPASGHRGVDCRVGAGSRNRMLPVFARWLSEASRWVERRMQKSPLGREDRGGFLLELCDGGCWAGGRCPPGGYRREVPRFRQTWAAEGAATPSDGPPATPRPNASLSIDWYSS